MTPHRRGIALCVISACGFGAMAIFAKKAYGEGVGVLPLLSLRFLFAAAAFWGIVLVRGVPLPPCRMALTGLGLGAAGYAAQAGLYFATLTRLDASLTALLLYIYPGLVFAGAVALGRDRATAGRVAALGLAMGGAALVLFGGGSLGSLDGFGVVMGLGAATVYATYILVADRVVGAVDPFALAALVCTGAAASLWVAGLVSGRADLSLGAAGYGWIAALALVSTVVAISTFFAGLERVGPSTASIVSSAEPVVTVALAGVVFGETLGALQLAGGALVLLAVVALQRRPGTVAGDAAPDLAAAPAPARPLARQPAGG